MASVAKPLRSLVAALPPGLRRRWRTLVPLSLAAALGEALAALAVVGLVRSLGAPGEGSGPVVAAALAALAFAAKNALLVAAAVARARVAEDTGAWIGRVLLARRLHGDPVRALAGGVAVAERDVLVSAHAAAALLAGASGLVTEVALGLGLVAVVAAASPAATSALVLALAALVGAGHVLVRGEAARTGAALARESAALMSALRDALEGSAELRALGAGARAVERFSERRSALGALVRREQVLATVPRAVLEALVVGGAAVAIAAAAHAGTLDLGLAGLLAYATVRLLPVANGIGSRLTALRSGVAAVRHLPERLVEPPVDEERSPVVAGPEGTASAALELRGASFRYPGAARPALESVSLRVEAGEWLGIAGPTGAGKSTLAALAAGLLVPASGAVHRAASGADGPVAAYVPPAPHVHALTLRENVALAAGPGEADPGRIREALADAALERWADALPAGLDTVLGDAGVGLSAGEAARLGLARALYARPALLVVDEATAALDAGTERTVLDAIARRAKALGAAVILVSHRRSVLERCRRVVRLEAGRLVAVGDPASALERAPGAEAGPRGGTDPV